MSYYHSGVNSPVMFELLQLAQVRHILVDPYDLEFIPESWDGNLALDAGTYKQFKQQLQLIPPDRYVDIARSRNFSLVFSQDVIGDNDKSFENWLTLRELAPDIDWIPTVQWKGFNQDHLDEYLKHCPLVAIGGLAKAMYDKDVEMGAWLLKLCQTYPNRFHVFGLNWHLMINSLYLGKRLVPSADSSKWIDGARYHSVIQPSKGPEPIIFFVPSQKLEQPHLITPPDADARTKTQRKYNRLIHNVKEMERILNPNS